MNNIFNPLLKSNHSESVVVIITGNPDRFLGHETLAENYYREIEAYIEEKGYTVVFDAGEPKTCPRLDVAFWVGHSRGADRIMCINPKDRWRFLEFGVLSGIIHPVDAKWQKKITDYTTSKSTPPKEHFLFTEEQKRAIDEISRKI